MTKKILAALALVAALTTQVHAEIIPFDFVGKAGAGLLSGNENVAVTGAVGSGGEVGAGITFDTATNVLTMNVGWGSVQGFSDLTGTASAGHLHGPVASIAPAAFTENASVKYGIDNLAGWNPSASNGGFIGTINILPGDVAALLAGRFYMNVHTGTNINGEIRGNLVAVPEPASLALVAVGVAGLMLRRRR